MQCRLSQLVLIYTVFSRLEALHVLDASAHFDAGWTECNTPRRLIEEIQYLCKKNFFFKCNKKHSISKNTVKRLQFVA